MRPFPNKLSPSPLTVCFCAACWPHATLWQPCPGWIIPSKAHAWGRQVPQLSTEDVAADRNVPLLLPTPLMFSPSSLLPEDALLSMTKEILQVWLKIQGRGNYSVLLRWDQFGHSILLGGKQEGRYSGEKDDNGSRSYSDGFQRWSKRVGVSVYRWLLEAGKCKKWILF